MANTARVVVVFLGMLVLLQVSCVLSQLVNVPAVMTVNGFQRGEGGGGPAACDNHYHTDQEFVVSLSTKWYAAGARCGKQIRIMAPTGYYMDVIVVDECRGCHNEVGASPAVWHNFGLHTSASEVTITWSDLS